MHKDQVRRSGEPYMTHPASVAWLLADLRFDQTCVAVGLLHDVLEDTLTTLEVLEREFGAEIAELVDGVTKIAGTPVRKDRRKPRPFANDPGWPGRPRHPGELADRMHNMMTLDAMAPEAAAGFPGDAHIYGRSPIEGMAKVKEILRIRLLLIYPLQFASLKRASTRS
jgi:GTP pyrophosphokinase